MRTLLVGSSAPVAQDVAGGRPCGLLVPFIRVCDPRDPRRWRFGCGWLPNVFDEPAGAHRQPLIRTLDKGPGQIFGAVRRLQLRGTGNPGADFDTGWRNRGEPTISQMAVLGMGSSRLARFRLYRARAFHEGNRR